MAPGDLTTLRALTDPDRRPPVPREPLTEEVATAQPVTPFELDPSEFLLCLRTARRGAAPGPSGMTSDHLFPLLESDHDSDLFCQVGSLLATGNIPTEVLEGFRLGRLTALRKPDGGVRGIVVGDIVRRLVARSMAKQIAKKVEQATSPFQYALSAKAGSECVAHVLQTLTDVDPNATVVSIDGVGAFDLISRNSMMRGLRRMEDGDQVLPFVRCFYGSPSTYLWEDELGTIEDIAQGEGGEQGDPLMPLLFALGQHAALEAVQGRLLDGEKLFAYLDDVYVICQPDRVADVHAILEEELFNHAHIQLNLGKTQVWNRGGAVPAGVAELTAAARQVREDATVWRGDPELRPDQQGVKVLGTPIGQPEFVQEFLAKKSREHQTLFERIPLVEDLQSSWLLLLMCGATRANFWLRTVRPDLAESFAVRHDARVWQCVQHLLGVVDTPSASQTIAFLPFWLGGLGLASAVRGRAAAHWASWAGLRMVRKRHPSVAETMVLGLERDPAPSLRAVRVCQQTLIDAGFEAPPWDVLSADSLQETEADGEPSQPKRGWQQKATRPVDEGFAAQFTSELGEVDQALTRSQHGPLASAPYTALPTSRHARIDSQSFRLLLCRRLRLPIPLCSRTCRCGCPLDILGHHRAACAEAGVLGEEGSCWSVQQPKSVARQGLGCPLTCLFATSTWRSTTGLMGAGLRWSPTASHCGKARSWPWTLQWCLPCAAMAQRDPEQRPWMVQL